MPSRDQEPNWPLAGTGTAQVSPSSARSSPCAPLQECGVRIVTRFRSVFVVSKPVLSDDAIEIADSGHVFAATVAGCGRHTCELDATTLSTECQQPRQPNSRGVAGKPGDGASGRPGPVQRKYPTMLG